MPLFAAGTLMAGAQCQSTFIIAVGHSADGAFRHADNGGKDHDTQKDGGGENTLSAGVGEQVLHQGHNHHQSKEAIDDGGNARQQIHCRLEQLIQRSRTELGHEDGGKQTQGHTHNNCPRSDIDAAQDHGENPVLFGAGTPIGTQQELQGADLSDGRQAVGKQIDAD